MAWSARTIETTHSTTGGALGTTHGSCLPGTASSVCSFVQMSSVSCLFATEAAGLNPTLITTGIPFDSPPNIPPALLVFVTTFPLRIIYTSLFSEPLILVPEKPEPNSTALTAGMLNNALLRSDSSEANIGSPNPTGSPVLIHSIIPPRESPRCLASRIASFILCPAWGSGHLTSLLYLVAIFSLVMLVALTPPISVVYATVIMPSVLFSSLLAIAPAITRVAVSLPENLPL